MSGVGKSYWSDKFEKEGFKVFHIDDLISEELGPVINKTLGDSSVDYGESQVGSLARWMGFPGDKRYEKNCKIYLKLEEKITKKSLNEAIKSKSPSIIDTTGSLIYLNKKILKELKKKSKIIYLDISKNKLKEMFDTFCKVPKPIIWGGLYKSNKNEAEGKTLARCYKKLLSFRIVKYNQLAHKVLPYSKHHKVDQSLKIF